MEQIQVMLNYPQVHTDMLFESVPTVALDLLDDLLHVGLVLAMFF